MNKHNDFVNREESQKAQNTVTDISATLDSMDHPYFVQKNLILSISANIGVFLVFLFLPRLMLLMDENFDFAEFFMVTFPTSIILPFVIGFLIGYSAIKLLRIHYSSQKANEQKIDSGMMSGYSQSQEQSKNWTVWLFASTCGVINLVVFTLLLEAVRKLL